MQITVVAVVLLERAESREFSLNQPVEKKKKNKRLRRMERTSTPLIEPAKYILQDWSALKALEVWWLEWQEITLSGHNELTRPSIIR